MKPGLRIAILVLALGGLCAAILQQQGRLSAAKSQASREQTPDPGWAAPDAGAVAGPEKETALEAGRAAASQGTEAAGPDEKPSGDRLRDKLMQVVARSPAIRELARTQVERNLDQTYASFFKTLPPEQARALRALLLDAQFKGMDLFFNTTGEEVTDAEKAELRKEADDFWKANREQIKDLLGEDGLERLSEYERTAGDRQQMAALKQALYGAGLDLSDEQSEAMLAMMRAAREKPVGPDEDPELAALSLKLPEERGVTGQEMDLRWQELYNARYLQAAAEILSPEQLKVFEKYLQQQLNVMETFADYKPAEMPEFHDRAEVQVGRSGAALQGSVAVGLDASKAFKWGDDQRGGLLTASNTANNTLAIHAAAGSGWGCGITFTPEYHVVNSDKSVDASGAGKIVARLRAPAGAKLRFGVIESGADWPWAGKYNSVNGADGEAFRHEGITTADGWQTYTVPLSELKLLGGYGNQKGNRTMDMQAVRSVEILYPGGQPDADLEVEWIRLE